jgi:hypothetical protein
LRWATGQDQLRNFAGDIALFAWFAVSFTTADYRSSPPRGYPILALKVFRNPASHFDSGEFRHVL